MIYRLALLALAFVFNVAAFAPDVVNTTETLAKMRNIPLPVANEIKCIQRLGYATVGDGGGGLYCWDPAETRTDDGGLIVNAAGNAGAGRWVAQGGVLSARQFGALSNGAGTVGDNLQAAVNSLQGTGRNLSLGPYRYLLTSEVIVSGPLMILGNGVKSDAYTTSCPAGVSAIIVNTDINALTLTATFASVQGICFQMASAPGGRNAGWAIGSFPATPPTHAVRAEISGNSFLYPWRGIYLTGIPASQNNGSMMYDNFYLSPKYAAIEIGKEAGYSNTPGLSMKNNFINCYDTINGGASAAAPNAIGILYYDGAIGDGSADANGTYGCDYGIKIVPGTVGTTGQRATGQFSGWGADSSKTADWYFGPTTSLGTVSLRIINGWASAAFPSNTTDVPIWIDNTRGGIVTNMLFSGMQVHSNYAQTANAMVIDGADHVLVSGSMFFGNGDQSVIGPAIRINNSTHVSILGNHIANDHQGGIDIRGGLTNALNISGNSNYGGEPFFVNTFPNTMTISNNFPVSGQCRALPLTTGTTTWNLPGAWDCFKTSGTGGDIWVMDQTWPGRRVLINAGIATLIHKNVGAKGLCGDNRSLAVGDSIQLQYLGGDNCWMSY